MNSPKKPDFDIKDIIAMIIASLLLILPPLLIIFGVIMAVYLLLKFVLNI
ncbi:MAG: hypothetical protein PHE70_02965 [Tepidanaerobacteraceae bacterium]|nr:hypothetical protein [Tepidanaerobacteraceae bacterium]